MILLSQLLTIIPLKVSKQVGRYNYLEVLGFSVGIGNEILLERKIYEFS